MTDWAAPNSSGGIELRAGGVDDLVRVEALWRALYAHQVAHGLLVVVPPDAFELWSASLRPVLGRFACLFVAQVASEPIGFLAGRVRSMPAYYGGGTVGYVSDVYVSNERRGSGVGKALLAAATEWFSTQQIVRVELQVIIRNNHAREFYRRLGWVDELVQMVWTADRSTSNR